MAGFFPMIRAASSLGIPAAVHESNAIPGLTTRLLEKHADLIMVGFEECRKNYRHPDKVLVTGTPVRGDFFRYTRSEARRELGFDDDRPLLLSYWGSLGAERMNDYMTQFLVRERAEGTRFRHIHGAGRDHRSMWESFAAAGVEKGCLSGVEVREYIYDMPLVMAAADLVLCRSGASTVSELAAIAKPSILIPSPNVTADHQTKNARILSEVGGAVLLPEKDCSGRALYETATSLLHDPARRADMARSLTALAVNNANEKIYTTLKDLIARG